MPSVTQLRYLLAVHRHGHFGRAAEEVGVSQPTLSMQVQKAERELGVVVFDRQAKPITATAKGAKILEHAWDVVSAHETLMRVGQAGDAVISGPLRLGVIPTLAPFVLPWFLGDFAASYPDVALSIVERPTDELIAEIRDGRIDGALLATPLDERSIQERVLFYDPFYLYCHKEDPLASASEVAVDALEASKLWLLGDAHCFRAQAVSFCGVHERRHLGSVRFSAGSFETIRNLIDASEGYTLIPETFARTLSPAVRKLSVRAFSGRAPVREVSLVHHSKTSKGDILEALERCVQEHLPRALRLVGPDGEILPIRVPS